MPRIVVRFIRTPGFVTGAICWATNSLFDHVEFGVEENGIVVGWIGAHAGVGVRQLPADYCAPSFERRYALPVTQAQYDRWRASALSDVGVGYNYLDIVGLALRLRRLTSPRRRICSQWAFLKLLDAGVTTLNVLRPYAHLVTPEMLHLSPVFIGRSLPLT